jgi:1-acyl-sn-glycerol-3-phosphate acyltransferase
MWKYVRVTLPILFAYVVLVIPNILLKYIMPLSWRYRMIRAAVQIIFPSLHINLEINHREYLTTKEPYLIISNHHGMVDPFLMIYLMKYPVRFISKKEVRKFPIFGDATASIDALFIDRKNVRSQVKAFQTMKASMLKRDTRWVIYPEGTRNRQWSQPMMPFKPGSFKHAMETKTAILPMVAYGFHRPLNKDIHMKRYPVQIDFLPPITPEMYAGKSTQEVATMIQAQMQARSDEMIIRDQLLIQPFLKKG